uniref:Olfactory receptor n=1 Tax=Salarias fasciatus TaxID=181472 RepID=A0A672H9B7_SALFA
MCARTCSVTGQRRMATITMNSTQITFFSFSAYFDTGRLKYLYFLVVMFIYSFIMFSNLLLIVVICVNRTLHEPMYLFLVSLFVNELCGSSGLFPLILVQILSDSHTVSVPLCFLQIFSLHFYGSVELFTLGAMSYDRYVAICCPLQYNVLMSLRKVWAMTASVWLYSVLATLAMLSLSGPLQLCGNIIHKVYCDNFSVVKLSCYDTTINNIYGLLYIFTVIAGLFLMILYSYVRILRVCLSGSHRTRQKALSTCTPHLSSMINFCFGAFFEIVQGRVSSALQIFLSLYTLTCQPLFNPSMYGLNLSKIHVFNFKNSTASLLLEVISV